MVEETDPEREARLDALADEHLQPVRREYVVEVTSSCSSCEPPLKRSKGRNRNRPREESPFERGTPAAAEDERNKIPLETLQELQRKRYAFETARGAQPVEETGVDPLFLRPRKLVDFGDKVYVAPLTTVGNLPFRRVLVDLGADITCGEMAVAQNLIEGQPSEWALLRRHASEKVFGVQIAAAHADQMGQCCELIRRYCDVDFVDVNCGCPIDPICRRGCGASLMRKRAKLRGVVETALRTVACAVTVKMRTGWTDDTPSAHTLVGLAQSWQHRGRGVEAVFVHGRSRTQRYSRLADWSAINRVATCQDEAAALIPVIGNGDILSHQDWEAKRAEAPRVESCAMLARGALIKPWLPTEIKERRTWDISASERLDILKSYVKYGLDHWGADACGVQRTRRFLLEWLSFLHRYTPAGLLERLPQRIHDRPPSFVGRSDLETLFASPLAVDWIKITEMLLGPVPDGFRFEPKHKANGYGTTGPPVAGADNNNDWG
ncbi:hypothetical protein CTAYLR_010171 [Chrysophaeum taylorii]|uniref:tRNA-dihydrouridine(47) synthase [NAD(P)(+)] n=1 Tax=Chrysophaeum taylorii TaxID=2483200 RepID=A0AAD7XQE3_9STRA|nr:hypothetical protein CTAYLR_010171 [Chrysophaeum taylorii]